MLPLVPHISATHSSPSQESQGADGNQIADKDTYIYISKYTCHRQRERSSNAVTEPYMISQKSIRVTCNVKIPCPAVDGNRLIIIMMIEWETFHSTLS